MRTLLGVEGMMLHKNGLSAMVPLRYVKCVGKI
jgi:hypothetical protein